MSAVIQRADGAARQAEVEFAMESSWEKAHRGRVWKIMGNEQFINGMWKYFTLRRAEAKKILEDAARDRQEGMQG